MKNKEIVPFKLIGEVSKELEVPSHVLRFWENKFESLSPGKRRGRRYYKKHEIELFKKIKFLLYEQKYTIEGAKKYLEHQDINSKQDDSKLMNDNVLKDVIDILKQIRNKLDEN